MFRAAEASVKRRVREFSRKLSIANKDRPQHRVAYAAHAQISRLAVALMCLKSMVRVTTVWSRFERSESQSSLCQRQDAGKVYIIDEVHMLSVSAFNALLKTLEEPPEHVLFIFATTEPHKIPDTILSRCQRFDFRRI